MTADEMDDIAPTRMVGVVVGRRKATSEWASDPFVVTPHAVLSQAPALASGAPLGQVGALDLIYLGSAELALWSGETGHYRDNLATGAPRLWVALTGRGERVAVHLVTANPYEGESLADSPGLTLEAVAMPPDIAADLAVFVARRHVEEVFVKRKRDKARGDAGPRGPGRRA
ncbi:MAG: DUF3305 domain-containing protein [Rhodoblastus sp.]|nr:MAG: DUF3305 domain-containing protein [Rhodoblastus sp.]